jgi:hypothetical protein
MACHAVVLQFPVKASCPCCSRTCNDEDLSECYTCGGKFCGSAKSNCQSLCECDRLAADFAERLSMMKPRNRMLRVVQSAAERAKVYLRFSEL